MAHAVYTLWPIKSATFICIITFAMNYFTVAFVDELREKTIKSITHLLSVLLRHCIAKFTMFNCTAIDLYCPE